jgi:hypothetical protein
MGNFARLRVLSAGLLLAAGCGGSGAGGGSDAQTTAVLRLTGIEYGSYLATHHGQPPKDAAAFRQYLESRLDQLAGYNVKSADDLLKSPRDGQPLVIISGKKVSAPDQADSPWAAYEQTGVAGKRMAVNVRGGVVDLTPEEFAQYVPVK